MSFKMRPILFWGREVNPILASFVGAIFVCVCCFPVFLSAVFSPTRTPTPKAIERLVIDLPVATATALVLGSTRTPAAGIPSSTQTATQQSTNSQTPIRSQTPTARFVPSSTSTRSVMTATSRPTGSCPQGCITPPPNCFIKGNISSNGGEKIYHVPGGASYEATKIDPTKGERWFCTAAEAISNGWRAALQ